MHGETIYHDELQRLLPLMPSHVAQILQYYPPNESTKSESLWLMALEYAQQMVTGNAPDVTHNAAGAVDLYDMVDLYAIWLSSSMRQVDAITPPIKDAVDELVALMDAPEYKLTRLTLQRTLAEVEIVDSPSRKLAKQGQANEFVEEKAESQGNVDNSVDKQRSGDKQDRGESKETLDKAAPAAAD